MKLQDAIIKYTEKKPARFHMPGHKGKLCSYDITELGFSDNLQNPCGDIKSLQEDCAKAYNANCAFILVNGSSAGICAFLTGLALKLGRRPRITVSRDCHKSFFSGAFFADALVCGIYPSDELCGVVIPEAVIEAVDKSEETPDAVFITSPNYYGMCVDTERLYNELHKRGILLFVDSAHGAHFAFSDELPKLPKCDVAVVSTHKTLAAYNQTGLLLCNCDMERELKAALNMLQTTSPSYPLMLSIGNAVDDGNKYKAHVRRIKTFREELTENGIKLFNKPRSAYDRDITRICISAEGLAKDGYALDEMLRQKNIYAEMADMYCVVFITTPYDDAEWYVRAVSALTQIKSAGVQSTVRYSPLAHDDRFVYTSVRNALTAHKETVNAEKAVGRISACAVGVYPPGTAIIFPGETITHSAISILRHNRDCGGELFGTDGELFDVTDDC